MVPLDPAVKTVVLLIGMAVGVDYALFYVIRSREDRARGLSSHEALERTAKTSGCTVVVAGTSVAIAMAGQFMIGSPILNGVAAGTIPVVACAVAGSVTVRLCRRTWFLQSGGARAGQPSPLAAVCWARA